MCKPRIGPVQSISVIGVTHMSKKKKKTTTTTPVMGYLFQAQYILQLLGSPLHCPTPQAKAPTVTPTPRRRSRVTGDQFEEALAAMNQKESERNLIPWDGALSSSDFFCAASAFSEKWKRFNPSVPPWLWVPSPKHHLLSSHKEEGYLSLEGMCFIKSSEDQKSCRSQTWKEESSISQEEAIDNATLVQSCFDEVNHYDFHIVYSPSYRVPVLYFRSYHSDGQPLPFDEIEKDLPDHSAKIRLESKWTFITQEEHPYLNRPWYKLHPCGTSEWMKLLFHGDASLNKNGFVIEHYLVSWFSVIGQVFGLKIPLAMLETVSC